MKPWSLGAAALAAIFATPAWAADPPPPSASEVVITGKRPDVVDRIDRRVYNTENDPLAQTGVASDILKTLPSVTISPEGDVALRGNSAVQVMVDGKPVSDRSLQRLPANQIASVEVMTNPSAEYAPDGTAGIINIITRKKGPSGLSGGARAFADTHGAADASGNLMFREDKWILKAGLAAGHSPITTSSRTDQQSLDPLGAVTGDLVQKRRTESVQDYAGLDFSAGYRLSAHVTLTLSGKLSPQRFDADSVSLNSGSLALGGYTETDQIRLRGQSSFLDLSYAYNGDRNGESLTLFARRQETWNKLRTRIGVDYVSPALPDVGTRLTTSNYDVSDRLKGDYRRGFAGKTLLTAGFSWQRDWSRRYSAATGSDPSIPAYVNDFSGSQTIASAYLTLQFPLQGWTLLPGLRVETVNRHFASGAPDVGETDIFPSLHLSHTLGKKAGLKLSYSRRLDRADVSTYDSALIYSTPKVATRGNPNLKPQTVDSFEINYNFDDKGFGFGASIYYRVTHNAREAGYSDGGGGLLILQPINDGERRNGGLELTLRGALGGARHWKYNINANVLYTRFSFAGAVPGQPSDDVSWQGNAMLQYDARPGGDGDQFLLNLQANGPQVTGLGRSGGSVQLDASYRHPLGSRLVLTLSATDIFNSGASYSESLGGNVRSRTDRDPSQQAVRIGLSWKFGGK